MNRPIAVTTTVLPDQVAELSIPRHHGGRGQDVGRGHPGRVCSRPPPSVKPTRPPPRPMANRLSLYAFPDRIRDTTRPRRAGTGRCWRLINLNFSGSLRRTASGAPPSVRDSSNRSPGPTTRSRPRRRAPDDACVEVLQRQPLVFLVLEEPRSPGVRQQGRTWETPAIRPTTSTRRVPGLWIRRAARLHDPRRRMSTARPKTGAMPPAEMSGEELQPSALVRAVLPQPAS